ncbi:MAG: hypothetical protein WCT16_02175 [Candidatus Buchananbacteria bacterium]
METLKIVLYILYQHWLGLTVIFLLFGLMVYGMMQIVNDNERLRQENEKLRQQIKNLPGDHNGKEPQC